MKLAEVLLENMMDNLIDLCKQELQLNDMPNIQLVDEPAVGGGSSFGEFTDNGIQVATKNRHPIDVMRTLAHELVHYKQRLDGEEMDGADGSDTENQANATAGLIMRRFGKAYPECFTLQSSPFIFQ